MEVYQLNSEEKISAEDSANRQKLISDIQEGETGRRPGTTTHKS